MGYPLVLTNLGQVLCVVVGGGQVAERKVGELIAGGARPLVISPNLTDRLREWQLVQALEHQARHFQPDDLVGAFLVIAATGDRAINQIIAAKGRQRGILVNLVDDPAAGNFHTVAAVRRADLLLTVSTGGANPALTAHIRRELATQYGPGYTELLPLLSTLRQRVKTALPLAQRQQFWAQLLSAPLLKWIEADQHAQIWELAAELIAALDSSA